MNRKKNGLIASTPHINRTHQVLSLFEDVGFSPIRAPSQLKVATNPQQIVQSTKPSGVRAVRKRTVARKEKAAPESVTAGVLKELGAKAQDVCNNALSQSRNLYNMFPEPIIIDSDDEENSSFAMKPPKKSKQDSRVAQSKTTSNREEKKITEPVPGSSSTTRLTRTTAVRKLKKPTSGKCSSSVPSSSKDLKAASKSKHGTKTKPPSCHKSTPSVVMVDDDDDSFYQPGSSVHQTSCKSKKAKDRFSMDLDEKFPIEWSQRRQKTTKIDEVPDVENNKVHQIDDVEKKKKKRTNPRKDKLIVQDKVEISNGVKPRSSRNKMIGKNDDNVVNSEKETPVLISRFEDVTFKVSNASGGIVAKCLKTAENNIGYMEVPADKVFNGQSKNITFVVIEGKAKFLHLGVQQTLSPGDMLHIMDDSGYQFESEGTGHVRFLYIKGH